jgi:hypothetical protein
VGQEPDRGASNNAEQVAAIDCESDPDVTPAMSTCCFTNAGASGGSQHLSIKEAPIARESKAPHLPDLAAKRIRQNNSRARRALGML